MLGPELLDKINNYLQLLNFSTLADNEIAVLNNITCKYQNYKGDCLALYLVCLIIRWRGSCNDTIIPKLQMLSDCNLCNINVDDIVNNKASKIYFGGVVVNDSCC